MSLSKSHESELADPFERIKHKLIRHLGKIPLHEAIGNNPPHERIEYPIIKRVQLDGETLGKLENSDYAVLAEIARDNLRQLDLREDELVFRAFAHPKQNITEELLARYGTDRFRGYGQRRLPQESEGLVPFRNQGETEVLTADTYAVPSLEWALAFTNLTLSQGVQEFREGRLDPYLVAYKSSHVFTERTPGGTGGEQWRGRFLTEPIEALATVIHFVHD